MQAKVGAPKRATKHTMIRRLLLASFLLTACTATIPTARLTLVETVPVGTDLGMGELPSTADVWVEMLEGADTSADLSHFYASDEGESLLGPVVAALEAAAARGVAVRFLCDERFYGIYPELLDRFSATPGMQMRRIDLGKLTRGVQHAKYMIMDGEDSFLGSPNFDWRSLEHIQELGLRVRSAELAGALTDVFEIDWAIAGGEPAPEPKAAPVSVTLELDPAQLPAGSDGSIEVLPAFSPQGLLADPDSWDLPKLVQLIDQAERVLMLQTLTFDLVRGKEHFEEIEGALLRAAERGVQVQLLVANWSLRRGVLGGLQELAAMPNIEVRYVDIAQPKGEFIPFARVIHSKFILADDRAAWLGTSNIERGYFFKSRNVGWILRGSGIGELLGQRFRKTWDSSYAKVLDPDGSYEPPPRELKDLKES